MFVKEVIIFFCISSKFLLVSLLRRPLNSSISFSTPSSAGRTADGDLGELLVFVGGPQTCTLPCKRNLLTVVLLQMGWFGSSVAPSPGAGAATSVTRALGMVPPRAGQIQQLEAEQLARAAAVGGPFPAPAGRSGAGRFRAPRAPDHRMWPPRTGFGSASVDSDARLGVSPLYYGPSRPSPARCSPFSAAARLTVARVRREVRVRMLRGGQPHPRPIHAGHHAARQGQQPPRWPSRAGPSPCQLRF